MGNLSCGRVCITWSNTQCECGEQAPCSCAFADFPSPMTSINTRFFCLLLLVMELVELVVWRRPEAKLIYTGKSLEGTGRKKVERGTRELLGQVGEVMMDGEGDLEPPPCPESFGEQQPCLKGVFRGAQVCVV